MGKLLICVGLALLLHVQLACTSRTEPLAPVHPAHPTNVPVHLSAVVPGGGGSSSGGSSSGGSRTSFCAGKYNGLYPNPTNKNHFYECSHGITYDQHCATNLVFDTSCKCCNWA